MGVKKAKEQDNVLKYCFFFIRSRVNQNLFSPLPWLQIAGFWWYACRADRIDIHSRDTSASSGIESGRIPPAGEIMLFGCQSPQCPRQDVKS